MTQSNEVFSSTGLVYYELTDLKEIIDNAVPADVDNLNGYEFDPKDKAEIVKAADSIIRSGKVYLTNHFPFAGSFGMNVRTFCSFDLQAPAAASVTQRGLGTYLNVMYNPLWMVYKFGVRSKGVFLVVDTGNETADRSERFYNVAALLYHEYSHLLWNHLDVYRYYFENGYGNIVNIAADCQINQDEFVANNKSLTAYGVTLESTKKLTQNPSLKAKEGSWYYFQALMKKMSQNKQSQGGGNGQQNQNQQQGQGNSQSQQQNNGQGQSGQQTQQGNGQGQTQQGQGNNQGNAQQQSQSQGSNQSQNQQQGSQSQNGNGGQQNQQGNNGSQNQQGQNGQGQSQSQQQQSQQGNDGQGQSGQSNQNQSQNQQGQGNGNGQENPMNPDASHDAWFNIPEDVKQQMRDEAGSNNQKGQGKSSNMHSDGLGQEDHIADKEAMTAKIADAIRKAMKESHTSAEEMKSRGLASGEMIDAAMSGTSKKGKLPIKSVIQKGAGRLKFGSHRTYSRINHHQGNRINILRGVKEDNHKNVNVFVDNSGSMSEDEINFAIGEIAAVAFKIKANLEVIPFDAQVYPEYKQTISKKGTYTYEPVGRGGTAFQPIFDYEKDKGATNQNDLIIILSDGYGESTVDTHGLRNIVYILVEETEDTLSVENPIGQVAWLSNDNKYKLHKMTNR